MDLAFHRGNAFLSRLIEYGTHSPYSHVELLFSDGKSFSARAECHPAVDIITADLSDGRWDLVTIPPRYPEAPVRAWCETKKGLGYDWAADFAFALHNVTDDPGHKLICSGSCTEALKQGVGLFTSFRSDQVSPGQLFVMAMVLSEVCG